MATEYLTPDEVASQLQVSRQVVYNWINDGRLRAVKAGRTLRVPQYALEAFLQPVHAGDISTEGVEPEPSLRFDRFTVAAQAVAQAAASEVVRRQHTQIEVEHQLWALMQPSDGILRQVLQRLNVSPSAVEQQLEQVLTKLHSDPTFPRSGQMMAISPRVQQILQRAEQLASQRPDLQIDVSHIILAICEETDGASAQILQSLGITPERVWVVLSELPGTSQAVDSQYNSDAEQGIEQHLVRIEIELAAIRALLPRSDKRDGG